MAYLEQFSAVLQNSRTFLYAKILLALKATLSAPFSVFFVSENNNKFYQNFNLIYLS